MIMTNRPNSFFNMQFITSSISTTLVLLLLGMVVFFVLSANNLSTYVRENIGISVLVSDDMKEPEALKFQKSLNEKSYVKESVTGDNTDVGGLVGGFRSKYVKIFASTNSAKVKGVSKVVENYDGMMIGFSLKK